MRLPFAVLVCHLILAASACAEFPLHRAHLGGDPNSPFNMGLQRVLQRHFARDTTEEKLEEDYLSLLELATSAEQEGLVYAHIAWAYCSRGTIAQPDAAETWCLEALSHPLSPRVEIDLYQLWAAALWTRYHEDWHGARYRVARRRMVVPALRGLKFVLDLGAPKELPPDPLAALKSVLSTAEGARRREILQEMARIVAANPPEKRPVDLHELVLQRRNYTSWCMNLYLHDPADPDELRRLASEALADHPEALADLLEQLAAAVADE